MGRLTVLFFLVVLVSGCESLNYYSQLIGGQWKLWSQRQSIDQILADESIDSDLRIQLAKVKAIRQYAVGELSLPDTKSYQFYTDIKRKHVVWNVFAAEEFSVNPKRWCFPIAGCVGYRGYFSKQGAMDFARQLSSEGYDTYIGGIRAYSTLGWFADPVLSTFLFIDDIQLAALIFHELAHQQLYLSGDTEFNESFATAVEIAGVTRWVHDLDNEPRFSSKESSPHAASSAKGNNILIKKFLRQQEIHQEFVALVLNTREKLSKLYQQDISEQKMRDTKNDHFRNMLNDYSRFRVRWGGYDKYDSWFNYSGRNKSQLMTNTEQTLINNAKLSTVASYNQWVPSFQAIISDCRDELACFYKRVKKLALLDDTLRNEALQELANRLTEKAEVSGQLL